MGSSQQNTQEVLEKYMELKLSLIGNNNRGGLRVYKKLLDKTFSDSTYDRAVTIPDEPDQRAHQQSEQIKKQVRLKDNYAKSLAMRSLDSLIETKLPQILYDLERSVRRIIDEGGHTQRAVEEFVSNYQLLSVVYETFEYVAKGLDNLNLPGSRSFHQAWNEPLKLAAELYQKTMGIKGSSLSRPFD